MSHAKLKSIITLKKNIQANY